MCWSFHDDCSQHNALTVNLHISGPQLYLKGHAILRGIPLMVKIEDTMDATKDAFQVREGN